MEKIYIEIKKYLPNEVKPEAFFTSIPIKIGKNKIKQSFEKDFYIYVIDWKLNSIKISFVSSYFGDVKPFIIKFNEEKKLFKEFSNFLFEIAIRYGE